MRTPQMTIDGWFRSRSIMRRTFCDRFLLPLLVADMLPAGDFLEDQQADAVAVVEEPFRLRIMRGADDIALQHRTS